MIPLTLGTLALTHEALLPNGKRYKVVFGYARDPGDRHVWHVYADKRGCECVLAIYDNEVAQFCKTDKWPHTEAFDATRYKPRVGARLVDLPGQGVAFDE